MRSPTHFSRWTIVLVLVLGACGTFDFGAAGGVPLRPTVERVSPDGTVVQGVAARASARSGVLVVTNRAVWDVKVRAEALPPGTDVRYLGTVASGESETFDAVPAGGGFEFIAEGAGRFVRLPAARVAIGEPTQWVLRQTDDWIAVK